MISGTVNHIKFKRLKRILNLKEWECVGLLESLWMLTAKSHIAGDIGRSENIDIAAAIEWDKDEDELINALIKCRWLDECEESRLVVHDWNIHCPNHVKGNISKHGKKFSIAVSKHFPSDAPREHPCEPPRETPREPPRETPCECPTKPSQAKPSQTQPQEGGGGGLRLNHPEFEMLTKCEPLKTITYERYVLIKHGYPKIKDWGKTIREICVKSTNPDNEIKAPDPWLTSRIGYAQQADEKETATRDKQRNEFESRVARGDIIIC